MPKAIESAEDFSMMYFRWVFHPWLVRDNDFPSMLCVSPWDLYTHRCFHWASRPRGLALWLEWEFKETPSLRAVLRAIGTFCSGWMTGFTTRSTSRRYGAAPSKTSPYPWTNWSFDKWSSDYCHLLRGYAQVGCGWGPFAGLSRFQAAVCVTLLKPQTLFDAIYQSCGYVAQQCTGQWL